MNITTAPTTIAELYALMREDAALSDRYYTSDYRLIRDISRNDDGSFYIWTNQNEQTVSGAAGVVSATPTPTPTAHPTITKRIGEYDPATGAYPAYVAIDDEGEQLIGVRWTAGDADKMCNEFIFDYYIDHHTPEKAAEIVVTAFEPGTVRRCGDNCCVCGMAATWQVRTKSALHVVCNSCYQNEFETNPDRNWTAWEADRLPAARVNWSEVPNGRLIPCAELHELRHANPDAFRARLAALPESDLEWQAAIYAAYASIQTGKNVTTEETLTRFRRSIAIHNARAAVGGLSEDDTSHVLFELALTDQLALIEFLRAHNPVQRDQLAWRFAAWLKRRHGIVREPAHIAANWAGLLGGVGENEKSRAQAQPGADERGQGDQHGPSTNGTINADYTTEARR